MQKSVNLKETRGFLGVTHYQFKILGQSVGRIFFTQTKCSKYIFYPNCLVNSLLLTIYNFTFKLQLRPCFLHNGWTDIAELYCFYYYECFSRCRESLNVLPSYDRLIQKSVNNFKGTGGLWFQNFRIFVCQKCVRQLVFKTKIFIK